MKIIEQVFLRTVKSKKNQLYLTVALLLSIGFYFTFSYTSPLTLFPNTEDFTLNAFDDRQEHGNSEVKAFSFSDSVLTFQYELKKGFSNPYAGFAFLPKKGSLQLDDFNQAEIRLLENSADNYFLFINTEDTNVTDKKHRLSARHSYLHVKLNSTSNPIVLDFEDLTTPNWWYEVIGQSPNSFGEIQLSKTKAIALTTAVTPKLDQVETLKIKSITFYKNNYSTLLLLTCFVGGLIMLLFFLEWLTIKKQDRPPIEIKYKATDTLEEILEGTEESFLEYIHSHYNDPELTLSKVADNSGVQERVISKLILDKFECNFKTYINKIRIEEAQRLLAQSKLNISEIAYEVGFNSPSSFNKVFKKLTGKTPSSSK